MRILGVSAAAIMLATVSFAQDTKPDTTKSDKTVEKRVQKDRIGQRTHRKFGRGMIGDRAFGHAGRQVRFGGLALTDAQKEQISAIREANKPDKALLDEIRSIRESRKAGTDLTAEQKARINTIHDQMRTKAQQVHDQIQNILTAEQKAQIEQRKTLRNQRMEQFRQKRQELRQQRELRKKPTTDTTTKKIV